VNLQVLVLGAGFGGLELSTILSESLADNLELTLIDKSDSFVFGYSKLDVMYGRKALDAVRVSYSSIDKPGVCFRQEEITAIDPQRRSVTTNSRTYHLPSRRAGRGARCRLRCRRYTGAGRGRK